MMPMIFQVIKEWGPLVTTLLGVGTAMFAVTQYQQHLLQKRAEMFFEWNKWFDSEEGFGGVVEVRKADGLIEQASLLPLIYNDDERLQWVLLEKREALLSFYEEIALARNSGLLSDDVANYTFGFYAVKIEESKYFWIGLDDHEKGYWKLFRHFAHTMKTKQEKLDEEKFNPSILKF